MSLIPLPEVRCGPYRQRKYPTDVVGTPNISYGHRLKERTCRVVPDARKRRCEPAERPEERREREHISKIWDFERLTNRRIRLRKVSQCVRQGMAAHEEDVNGRREKLRELILDEEVALTREIVDQAQHGDDARMEEMRLRTEEVKRRQEEQRLAMVAAKRMQQYLNQCPEIRDKLAGKAAREVKRDNLAQMMDNEALKQAEAELDTLWHELMLREVEAKEQREIEELKRRKLTDQERMTILAKQMAGKLALDEEKRRVQQEEREYLERLWESVREEELKNLERERKSREALKRDLEEQIVTAKRFLAERAREEAAMDQTLKALAEEELAKEKATIKESSEALRKELLAYLQYLEEIRQEEARRNLEVDAIVAQSTKDAQARRDLAKKKFKEAQKRGLREMLRVREEQLRMRREEERKQSQLQQMERELLDKQIKLDAKLIAEEQEKARRRAACYGKELKEQQHQYVEGIRRREAEEEEKIRKEELEREQEYQRLTEELLASSEIITPHPFKVLLKECAARRAAEKEGHCYCPPPVPLA